MSDAGDDNRPDGDERGPGIWVAGLILIGVGFVFLFQNLGYAIPGNWWSLFVLVPAFFAFASAWRSYQRNGSKIDGATAGSLLTGIVLVALTGVFMFDLDVDWNVVWPLILIVVGAIAVGRAYLRR
ncbi:MAG: hypothetical protein GY798_25425 [Hyphomicrobiales bacterium]|nr:hypothetical protein [Hyphomicrobiales bacterium]